MVGRIESYLKYEGSIYRARPLDLDFNELLTLAGYPSLEPSMLTKGQRDRLRAELHKRVDRVIADSKRIKEITDQLLGKD